VATSDGVADHYTRPTTIWPSLCLRTKWIGSFWRLKLLQEEKARIILAVIITVSRLRKPEWRDGRALQKLLCQGAFKHPDLALGDLVSNAGNCNVPGLDLHVSSAHFIRKTAAHFDCQCRTLAIK